MSKVLNLLLVLIISSCAIIKDSKDYEVCDCCNQAYSNINNAIKCISEHPKSSSTSDKRLFLIAFVSKDIKKYQDKGWNIIEDNEIIKLTISRF